MRCSSDNPEENTLGPSTSEDAIVEAIRKSGYPLQGLVAAKLKQHFQTIAEEWAYLEEDDTQRSLDVFAETFLCSWGDERPSVFISLLVECKRSHEPFIFFTTAVELRPSMFPVIEGIPFVGVHAPEGAYNTGDISRVLGLEESSFIRPGPLICPSFAKVELNGKKATLSGTTPFSGVVLPLCKAMDHARDVASQSRGYRLLIALCVVDAPMLALDDLSAIDSPVLTPWVRVPRDTNLRIPAGGLSMGGISTRRYAIDFVHVAFLDRYISEYVWPLGQLFVDRLSLQRAIIANGADADSLRDWRWDNIAPRPST